MRKIGMLVVGVLLAAGCDDLAHDMNRLPTSARQCRDTNDAADALDKTDPEVQRTLHHRYYTEGCLEACDKHDDAYSCSIMAHIYSTGKGLEYDEPPDFTKAATYAKKVCEIENDPACDAESAYRCLADEAACEARCKSGAGKDCVALADPIDDIGGKKYDGAKAAPLHALACKAEIAESCEQERKIVCASDPAQCKARCDADDARACYRLGFNLVRGIGELSKDPVKGLKFKTKACELDASVDPECKQINNNAALGDP